MASAKDHVPARQAERGQSPAYVMERLEKSYLKKDRSIIKDGLNSRFLASLVGFSLVGTILAATGIANIRPLDFPVHTWTTWAINDFLKTAKPDVVLMGSSLMLVPLDGVDADFLNKKIDGSAHHRSFYLENRYQSYSGQKARSFNFALPGEMPSDAYMITRFLLKGERAPKVLVYGVGPRDFMDNLLPSPAATDPFQFLSRLGNWDSRVALIMPQWQERLSYELGKLCYTYGVRGQIALDGNRLAGRILDEIAPRPESKLSQTELIALRRKLLPDYKANEVNRNECMFRSMIGEARPAFQDNIQEYRKRYKTLKRETFDSQMTFLQDILQMSKERGIHVLLVAMPITDVNRSLLSDSSWALYKTSLKKVAVDGGASFYDLHQTGRFKLDDFQDTVHLHSGGGAKLLDQIAAILASDAQCRAALQKDATNAAAFINENRRIEESNRREAIAALRGAPL